MSQLVLDGQDLSGFSTPKLLQFAVSRVQFNVNAVAREILLEELMGKRLCTASASAEEFAAAMVEHVFPSAMRAYADQLVNDVACRLFHKQIFWVYQMQREGYEAQNAGNLFELVALRSSIDREYMRQCIVASIVELGWDANRIRKTIERDFLSYCFELMNL